MAEVQNAAYTSTVFAKNNVAVITGGANGIGRAVALRCAQEGMRVCIADISEAELNDAQNYLVEEGKADPGNVMVSITDVSDKQAVMSLAETVIDKWEAPSFLMNNAGTGAGGGPYDSLDGWEKVLGVNMFGVIYGVHAFTDHMVNAGKPGLIVNTGSKQGITCPPGNTAYNTAKAGVKVVTEGLSYKLRQDKSQVRAALLVPGWVNTSIVLKVKQSEDPNFDTSKIFHEKNPAKGAWMPSQVVDYMFEKLDKGDFYIICPDNDVTEELDNKRVQWTCGDIVERRQPLSRWDPEYKEDWEKFLKE